jgi:hypothetical protein
MVDPLDAREDQTADFRHRPASASCSLASDRERPPSGPSRRGRRLFVCLAISYLALVWRGPVWLAAWQPRTYHEWGFLADFFQEWASARNYYEGLPIYTSHEETLPLYLGQSKRPGDTIFTSVNAHPPPSVLLALPLGKLDYADAFVIWNATCLLLFGATFWLVLRALRVETSAETVLVILTVLLFCHPLRSHVEQGQLNIPVVFLVTLCWFLDRSDRPCLAGVALGVAAALKLFPGFLFLVLILRRRWAAVLSGLGALAGLSALTLALLGAATYRDYVGEVLPSLRTYWGAGHNLSLCGVWHKLLAPTEHWMPITFASVSAYPVAAMSGYLVTSGVVVLLVSWIVLRASEDVDLAYAASIVAMVLLSPIAWDHYLLLLVLPIALLWRRLRRSGVAWPVFLFLVALLCVEPLRVMHHCLILMGAARGPGTGHWVATPLDTLTALSVPCYAIAGLFLLMFCAGRPGAVLLPFRTSTGHDVVEAPAASTR